MCECNYKIEKEQFKDIDINCQFFDSFRAVYGDELYNEWVTRKSDDYVYVARNSMSDILGFLKLKVEDKTEDYSDITTEFIPTKRLKISAFKVSVVTHDLKIQFLTIISKEAKNNKVKEIYLTVYPKFIKLINFFEEQGFRYKGEKITGTLRELVLVLDLKRKRL